jgi:hypothetical protein
MSHFREDLNFSTAQMRRFGLQKPAVYKPKMKIDDNNRLAKKRINLNLRIDV